jgi:transposase
VVDSASIEVNRRARRAKTDRLDGDKLLSMLIRYHAEEPRVWSVVRVPTPLRRAHRELGRLGHERTAHINRIRALLVLNNVRVKDVGGRRSSQPMSRAIPASWAATRAARWPLLRLTGEN